MRTNKRMYIRSVEGLFPDAIQALEEITPHHSWEDVRKGTLLIYAREFAWGRLEADSQYELEQLNILSPFYFGEGIFSSRVMTDYIALFEGAAYKNEYGQSLAGLDLIVYPNPARDEIIVDFGNVIETDVRITWMNMLGQAVHSTSHHVIGRHQQMDVTHISRGLYIIKLEWNDRIETVRVLLGE